MLFICGGRDRDESTCCGKFNVGNDEWKFVGEMNEAGTACDCVISCGMYMWLLVLLVNKCSIKPPGFFASLTSELF